MDEFTLWASGKTYNEVAELTGKSKYTIYRSIKDDPRYKTAQASRKKIYKPRKNTRQDINSDLSRSVVELYSSGKSMEEVGKALGYTRAYIFHLLSRQPNYEQIKILNKDNKK